MRSHQKDAQPQKALKKATNQKWRWLDDYLHMLGIMSRWVVLEWSWRDTIWNVGTWFTRMAYLIHQWIEEHTKMAIVGSPRNGSKKVDGKAYSYLRTSQFNTSTAKNWQASCDVTKAAKLINSNSLMYDVSFHVISLEILLRLLWNLANFLQAFLSLDAGSGP